MPNSRTATAEKREGARHDDANPPPEQIHRLEQYHDELLRHAARLLGSDFEAEDAVQETIVRAWNALDRFEGRSQLRSWLYRICTNVCLDMLSARQRRARALGGRRGLHPADALEPAEADPSSSPGDLAAQLASDGDPADVAVARESVRLAFTTVLRHLPPRQRAVLILREVLHWSASEVAELLGTSVSSVNSALQRARATLQSVRVGRKAVRPPDDLDREVRARVGRYVAALESSDVDALTALLRREAA